ncbi:ATP-binding protein [Sphingomonas sp. KRR8]|uniref:AAA family ATPase n=1 Tax=Sphingomonas sp. KRR8 TaxID=2942996 RepID=UPI002021DD30|nr:ATP-binding protein [Sphingomonas sp. KRR8]URD60983.1 ATP-binding protein [Sphingomonas sp. KRR8]
MRSPPATLHMFCGIIASGKSTLAKQLSEDGCTAVVSEDRLLSSLYPGEIRTVQDYARCAGRLRNAIGPLIVHLLSEGVSVALDFQANTKDARAWMRSLFEKAGAQHKLDHIQAPEDVCLSRLQQRNASGTHEYQVSETDFRIFNSFIVSPTPEEGFDIVVHHFS